MSGREWERQRNVKSEIGRYINRHQERLRSTKRHRKTKRYRKTRWSNTVKVRHTHRRERRQGGETILQNKSGMRVMY